MRTLPRQGRFGHTALACAALVAAAALKWPLLWLLLPFPLLLTGRLSPSPRAAVAVYAVGALITVASTARVRLSPPRVSPRAP